MNAIHIHKQRGVTLTSLIAICFALILVAVLGMKVAPDVIEYLAIVKAVKATAADPAARGAGVAEVRNVYNKRRSIDNITSVAPSDLDITKEGNDIVIAFSYTKRIPLYGPVSLAIDFEGSSAQ